MDPNVTLREIDEFLKARRAGSEVDVWCRDLFDWLDKGGFEPNWGDYLLGSSYYKCREISEKKNAEFRRARKDY